MVVRRRRCLRQGEELSSQPRREKNRRSQEVQRRGKMKEGVQLELVLAVEVVSTFVQTDPLLRRQLASEDQSTLAELLQA